MIDYEVTLSLAVRHPDMRQVFGIQSARLHMQARDPQLDDSPGLNCAWYADVLDAPTQ